MVNLGFMIPTDEEHNDKLEKMCRDFEISHEKLINDLIDLRFKEVYGGVVIWAKIEDFDKEKKFTSLVKEGIDKIMECMKLENGMSDTEKITYISNCFRLRFKRYREND